MMRHSKPKMNFMKIGTNLNNKDRIECLRCAFIDLLDENCIHVNSIQTDLINKFFVDFEKTNQSHLPIRLREAEPVVNRKGAYVMRCDKCGLITIEDMDSDKKFGKCQACGTLSRTGMISDPSTL